MVSVPSFSGDGGVVYQGRTGTTVSVPLPGSAVPGQLALLVQVGCNSGSDPAGWTRVLQTGTSMNDVRVCSRVLTSGDLSAGSVTVPKLSSQPVMAVVTTWAGTQSVAVSAAGGGTSSTFTSMTVDPNSLTVYGAGFHYSDSAVGTTALSLSGVITTRVSNVPAAMAAALAVGDHAPGSTTSSTGGSSWAPAAATLARVALSLDPMADPDAPTLQIPADPSYRSVGAPVTYSWAHNPGQPYNGGQSAFSFRRTPNAGSPEYLQADGSWSASQAWITSSQSQVTLPAWSAGEWDWSVATREAAGGRESVFAVDATLTFLAGPTVAVTAPAGTVTDATPTVTWTTTLDSLVGGFGQTAWQARIFTAAQTVAPGFDPDTSVPVAGSAPTVGTATSWTVPVTLDPGTAYVAYVTVAETGNVWSPWGTTTFTVDAVVSGSLTAPGLTATLGVLTSGAPAVELALTSVGGAVQVQCSDDAGVTWATAVGTRSTAGSLWDATGPIGAARSYRARVTDGTSVSAWSSTAVASLAVTGPVLVDLTTGWAVLARLAVDDTRTRPAQREVLTGLGRDTDLVLSDVVRADRGAWTIRTRSLAGMDEIQGILAHGLVMMRWMVERADDGTTTRPPDDVVQVTSDLARDRLAQVPLAYRTHTVSWTRQPAPGPVLWTA